MSSEPSPQNLSDTEAAPVFEASTTPRARPNPSRLQVHTAKQLLSLIRQDDLQPGYHLREEALAQRLGVSRTSVRAGLRILHEKGLVTSRQNRGYTLAVEPDSAVVALELPTSADESLYMRIVRDRIVGALPQCITESELMRRYDCGRNLVLAALATLSEEGLVRRGRGREWQFRETLTSPETRRQNFELRLMVEPAALLLDSFKMDRADLLATRARQAALIAPDGHPVSWRELFEADASFHELLGRFSGNAVVLDVIRQQNRLRRLMEYESYPDAARVRAWTGEHIAVIDALIEGDRVLASERMMLHLRNAMTPSARKL